MERWGVDRVMALAPDSASQVAGRKLATPKPWSDIGWAGTLLWGSCQGSGRTPYQVAIELTGPTYKCSCPSRKFPCKHVLALLFLWAEGQVAEGGGLSEFASEWAAKKQAKETSPETDEPAEQTPEQRAQAEARAAQRAERVAAGLAELDRWLADQLTIGLVSTTTGGFQAADQMAARMVDAQAPGVASRLRELPRTGSGGFERLLGELALIRLLITANAADLADDQRATVRNHLGYSVPRSVALANPPVSDHWLVTGMKDADTDQVSTRRVWLLGRTTGRTALVLSFATAGGTLDNSLLPGMVVDADLHFYPGRPQVRAAVGERRAELELGDWRPDGGDVAAARRIWRDALTADPWLTEWPVALVGTLHARPSWTFRDGSGDTVPVIGGPNDLAQFLALAGPHPTLWFGEIGPDGFAPTSALIGDRLVTG
ncbi:MAG: SWIM zinc finger family protein [Propionicimonas sp.]